VTLGGGRAQDEAVIVPDSPTLPETQRDARATVEEVPLHTAPTAVVHIEPNPDTQRAPVGEIPPANGSGAMETDRAARTRGEHNNRREGRCWAYPNDIDAGADGTLWAP
jgi:hypothetical protein